MRQLIKIALLGLTGLVLIVSGLTTHPAAAAGSARLYLSPSTTSVTNGNNLVVQVYEDSGSEAVNAVQANLNYPTNLLSYVSYSSSSAFNIEAENPSGNTGNLRFGRGTITPRTGAQLVVTITFKAVASSGTATVDFASGSSVNAADGSGTDILTSTSGGSYTLKAPASASGSSGSSSSSGVVSKSDKTAPKITNITTGNISDSSVDISWETSEPATSEVRYGASPENQISSTDTNLVTTHKITLGGGVLLAGQTYYFKVKSADAAGNMAESENMTFSTSGVSTVPGTNAGTTESSSNLGRIAAIVAGSVLLAAAAGSGLLFYRNYKEHHLAKSELRRHFPDIKPPTPPTPPTPPASSGPTIIYPTNQAKA